MIILDVLGLTMTVVAVLACLISRRCAPRWRYLGVILLVYWLWSVPISYSVTGSLGPVSAFALGFLGIPGIFLISSLVPSLKGILLLGAGSFLTATFFVAVVWAIETQLLGATRKA
jgi:hypothetical protein